MLTLLLIDRYDHQMNKVSLAELYYNGDYITDDKAIIPIVIMQYDDLVIINLTQIDYPHQSLIYDDESNLIGKIIRDNYTSTTLESLKEFEKWNLKSNN